MLCSLDVPLLFVDSPVFGDEAPLKADYLYMENQLGISSFVAEMVRRGKKRIGFIGEYMHCQSFYERYMGYRNAMYLSGLPCCEEYCILGNQSGIKNPDSTQYQEYLEKCFRTMKNLPTPSLTTIRTHSQIMGVSAVQLLESRIKEPTLNTRIVHTETNLIYRESTGD